MKSSTRALILSLAAGLALAPLTQAVARFHKDPVKAYIKRYDKNHNGVIDKDEFPGKAEDFDKWDKNKDGKLETYEVKAMLQATHHHGRRLPKSTTASASN